MKSDAFALAVVNDFLVLDIGYKKKSAILFLTHAVFKIKKNIRSH